MSTVINIQISGPKLRKARGKRPMAEVARILGIHRQQLWQIERDLCRATGDLVAKLCVLYGVDISDITRTETNGKRKAA